MSKVVHIFEHQNLEAQENHTLCGIYEIPVYEDDECKHDAYWPDGYENIRDRTSHYNHDLMCPACILLYNLERR